MGVRIRVFGSRGLALRLLAFPLISLDDRLAVAVLGLTSLPDHKRTVWYVAFEHDALVKALVFSLLLDGPPGLCLGLSEVGRQ